jgi:hypothetical protein
MIKIIKNGVPDKKYNKKDYNYTCKNCDCEFTFEKSDLVFEPLPSPHYGIMCPWCFNYVYIESSIE